MEPENGPLEKEIPFLETIISSFQPLIFEGVNHHLGNVFFLNNFFATTKEANRRSVVLLIQGVLFISDVRASKDGGGKKGGRNIKNCVF